MIGELGKVARIEANCNLLASLGFILSFMLDMYFTNRTSWLYNHFKVKHIWRYEKCTPRCICCKLEPGRGIHYFKGGNNAICMLNYLPWLPGYALQSLKHWLEWCNLHIWLQKIKAFLVLCFLQHIISISLFLQVKVKIIWLLKGGKQWSQLYFSLLPEWSYEKFWRYPSNSDG